MKLATKARYGVTAMMDLAINENIRPVTLADISQYQGISLSYLEQLFAKLRSRDLVRGVRGPGGGYRLARSASEISIAQIVSAINDTEDKSSSESMHTSNAEKADTLNDMWDKLSGQIYQFLDGITLDQFVKEGAAGGSLTGKLSKTGSPDSDVEDSQAIA